MTNEELAYEGELGYEMSFLIRSCEDATRLLRVLQSQFDAEDFDEEPLNVLGQMVAQWDKDKPQNWHDVLLDATGKIEEFLMETAVEEEFAHRCQSVIEALGFAACRLEASESLPQSTAN